MNTSPNPDILISGVLYPHPESLDHDTLNVEEIKKRGKLLALSHLVFLKI